MNTRRSVALMLCALLMVTACGKKKGATPTEAFKSFYTAATNEDVAGLKEMMSKAMLADMEREAQKSGQELDKFLAGQSKNFPPGLPETRNEQVNGDRATLEFKRAGALNWSRAVLVKEDGEWKMSYN
jgi:hypothetical protein